MRRGYVPAGSLFEPQLRDEVVAVDREAPAIEHDLRRQLRRDTRAQLGEPSGLGRQARADIVRLAELEQLLERARPDPLHLGDEPPDRCVDQFGS